jgi:hypothetical protein
MTRPADTIKAVRSYVVQHNSTTKKLEVKESHWVPGYSTGHKATPGEAIEHAIVQRQANMVRINDEIHELELMTMADF